MLATQLKYGAATQIIVTEFNEIFKKFQVIMRAEIPRGDFTLDNAVKKIIELNDIYNPKFLYIDRGFGEKMHVICYNGNKRKSYYKDMA